MTLEESFRQMWRELDRIGRDPVTGGYHRFAWTAVDRELAAWFRAHAQRRGMAVADDRNGNQWAWWGDPARGAIATGSHLDSVPGGGAFDGPLGVVAGFLAVDELRARLPSPACPIAVVRFADEEGARFGVPCIGSRLLTGTLDPDDARQLRDADGVPLGEAMLAAGVAPDAMGRDDDTLTTIAAFVELHIEQGRALADLEAPVGVARTIWPHGRWRCTFTGEANHAGTTRLAHRRDAMLPFASTVLAARAIAEQAGALATVGKVRVEPGGANAIAAEAHAWLDARAKDEATLRTVVDAVQAAAEAAADAHRVAVEVTAESYTPAVEFDPALQERLRRVVAGHFGAVPALSTGAGHDAAILSAVVPSAMLFVRNPTGVSHSPAEHADEADCLDGIRVLSAVLEDLAC